MGLRVIAGFAQKPGSESVSVSESIPPAGLFSHRLTPDSVFFSIPIPMPIPTPIRVSVTGDFMCKAGLGGSRLGGFALDTDRVTP